MAKLGETVTKPEPGLLDFGPFKPNESDDEREPDFGADFSGKEGKRRGRPPKPKLDEKLTEFFTLIGVGVIAFNEYDGLVILKRGPKLAEALNELAKEDEKIREALEKLLTVSTWGAVVTASASIAVPIAANHRLLPSGAAAIMQAPHPVQFREKKQREREEEAAAAHEAAERGQE